MNFTRTCNLNARPIFIYRQKPRERNNKNALARCRSQLKFSKLDLWAASHKWKALTHTAAFSIQCRWEPLWLKAPTRMHTLKQHIRFAVCLWNFLSFETCPLLCTCHCISSFDHRLATTFYPTSQPQSLTGGPFHWIRNAFRNVCKPSAVTILR